MEPSVVKNSHDLAASSLAVLMFWGTFGSMFSNIELLTDFSIKGRQTGVFQTGGFPDLDLSFLFCPFLSFSGLSRFFRDFPICSGMVRGFFRFVLLLFLGLLRAPTRNSPERVRDTIWTFPEKSGKHPGLETPRFSFSQVKEFHQANLTYIHSPPNTSLGGPF